MMGVGGGSNGEDSSAVEDIVVGGYRERELPIISGEQTSVCSKLGITTSV